MGLGENFFLGRGPNNRNNGNNGVWLAVVVLVVSNRLLFKPGSKPDGRIAVECRYPGSRSFFLAKASSLLFYDFSFFA